MNLVKIRMTDPKMIRGGCQFGGHVDLIDWHYRADKGIDTDYGIVTSRPQGGLRESREDPNDRSEDDQGRVPVWRACRPD